MATKIIYWVSTVFISLMMLMSGSMMLFTPQGAIGATSLGYPSYFPYILGPAKLAGALALILPVPRFMKEWAYAGFFINFASAAISHGALKDYGHVGGPLVGLVILLVSYVAFGKYKKA